MTVKITRFELFQPNHGEDMSTQEIRTAARKRVIFSGKVDDYIVSLSRSRRITVVVTDEREEDQ